MALLIKPIKDVEGNVTALGELTAGDVAEVTDGGIQFNDGTIQTTAAVSAPAAPVTTVFTRVGDVVAVAGDYTAAQVTLDPTNVAGVDGTNVQLGFEQLGSLITSTASGLIFMGQLAFDAADPVAPTESPSHYYIFNTSGERPGVGPVQAGDHLTYNLQTLQWVHLDYANRTHVASQIGYDGTGNTYITGPEVDAALDQADGALVAIDTRLDALEAAPGGVSSFNTRTGAVVPAAGDYTATQTTFAPTANNSATNVQTAIQNVGMKAIPFYDTTGTLKPIPLI